MRFKLDENLPTDLVNDLAALGHDVDTVPQEGLAGHVDPDVWAAAQSAERMLVTQDLDFSDVRLFRPGGHHGLILVRLREPSRSRLRARLVHAFEPSRSTHGIDASLSLVTTKCGCGDRRIELTSLSCAACYASRHDRLRHSWL